MRVTAIRQGFHGLIGADREEHKPFRQRRNVVKYRIELVRLNMFKYVNTSNHLSRNRIAREPRNARIVSLVLDLVIQLK